MPEVTITIDSRVRVPVDKLGGDLVRALREEFTHTNPQWVKKRAMGYKAFDEPREYRTYAYTVPGRTDVGDIHFPRGGFERVVRVLASHGVAVEAVVDNRTPGQLITDAEDLIPPHRYEMRGYQAEAIAALDENNGGLLRAPTGSGKTVAAFGWIACKPNMPALVVVWSKGLFAQWFERAEKELGIDASEVGVIREDKFRLRPLTIAMQQTLAAIFEKGGDRAQQVREMFGQVVLDETQRAAAKTVFAAIDPLPAVRRLGVSADETRADQKEFLIYDLFGPVAHDIPHERLVNEKAIIDVEVRIVPTRFEPSAEVERGDFDALLKEMTVDDRRNAIVDRIIAGEVARGQQVLVLTHRRDHATHFDAAAARAGYRSGLLLGTQTREDEEVFERARLGLLDGSVQVAAGTIQAVGQGIDIPKLSVGVVATPLASKTSRQQFGQVRGRFCRPKDDARLYYLWDRQHYGLAPVENLAKWNRKCLVLDGGQWVDAREFVKREKSRRRSFV